MKWLARWFSPRRAPAAGLVPAAAFAAPAPAGAPAAAAPVTAAPPLLGWLLDCAPLAQGDPTPAEQRVLDAIDAVLAAPTLPEALLPRAATAIPQLLALLRQTDLPVPALAERIARDPVLSAEVLRLASSAFYRAQGEVADLRHAIVLVGEAGLKRVIARLLVKPVFEATPGPLGSRAAPRLWEHAQALAPQLASAAQAAGLPAFDGYLVGLLHGSGWGIALRIADRADAALPLPPTSAFAVACAARAHRLFGLAARRWPITPGFAAVADDACQQPLDASAHPLAAALRDAAPPVADPGAR